LDSLLQITVSVTATPVHFGFHEGVFATGKGAWLSFLVCSVIVTGLFFRELIGEDEDFTGNADRASGKWSLPSGT